jgi:hypothetical protein
MDPDPLRSMARMALGDPRAIKGIVVPLNIYICIYIILLLKINTKQNNNKIHFPLMVLPSGSDGAKQELDLNVLAS